MFLNTIELLLLIVCLTAVTLSGEEVDDSKIIEIVRFKDNEVKLPCDLTLSDPPRVTWQDLVYNTGREASVSYNSSDGQINSEYIERGISVNPKDFSLTIEKVFENMTGKYFCESILDDGTKGRVIYQLKIITNQNCSGNVNVTENDLVVLDCTAYTQSPNVRLDWLADVEATNDTILDDDFSKVHSTISLTALPDHHNKTFVCIINNDRKVSCSLVLNVKYKVRNIILPSVEKQFFPGDEVTCQASGNPVPHVLLTLPGNTIPNAKGKGRVSIIIFKEMIGKKVIVECEAKNEFKGVEVIEKKDVTISITERIKTLELPSDTKSYFPGDLVMCWASGRPRPDISMTLSSSDGGEAKSSAAGEVSMYLGDELAGGKVKVVCEAKTEVRGQKEVKTKNIVLTVLEKPVVQGSVLGSGSESLLIIIIIIVVIVVIVLIIAAVIIFRRKKGRKEQKSKDAELLKTEQKKDYKNDMI